MNNLPTDEYSEWIVSVDSQSVATIKLTHEKSAVNKRGLVELRDIVSHLANEDSIDAIVVTGGSDAFCVGLDIGEFVHILDETPGNKAERRRRIRELVRIFHASITEIRNAPQPVIAAVDGIAAGGGFSLVLAADYVIASTDAAFTHAYTDIGATADGGSTYFLPHLVGMQKAKELVFAPQPLSSDEMANLGVVNEIVEVDLHDAVNERAAELAGRPSEAIARTKHLLNEAIDSTMETHLEREREEMAAVVTTEEFEKRVREFQNHRR